MGNCLAPKNYDLAKKEFNKRKSNDFRIEMDMCEKLFANEKNALFMADQELEITRSENEKLRLNIHNLIHEQSDLYKRMKVQQKINSSKIEKMTQTYDSLSTRLKVSTEEFSTLDEKIR